MGISASILLRSGAIMSDFDWYLSVRHVFSLSPKHSKIFVRGYGKKDANGRKAFDSYDSRGVLICTRHPRVANAALRAKEAVNFQVKQWAEGMAWGYILPIEIKEFLYGLRAPDWVFKACQAQKWKIYFKHKERIDEQSKMTAHAASNLIAIAKTITQDKRIKSCL